MTKPIINQTVLMSGADYFRVEELNPYSHKSQQPDVKLAIKEHAAIRKAFEQSGIEVVSVDAPKDCQDGIYTANWGLCWKGKILQSSLPNLRQAEEPYAKKALTSLGYEVKQPPFKFSGQGDALPCGDYLFVGSTYRTDPRMHTFLQEEFDCQVIGLQTIPELDNYGNQVINALTKWPDSYFYDIDLALAVITPDLIAWCPEAFIPESRQRIQALPLQKITVSLEEAKQGFACNLLSTGETVIMSSSAPELKKAIENHGLKTITPIITELSKGGGYIRCSSLTLC
jgi:N-dimethylarginine dimethylaminohydrolase